MTISGKILSLKYLGPGMLLLVAGVWWAIYSLSGSMDPEPQAGKVVVAEKHSFPLIVVERGIVRPAKISPISSEISSNQAKIVWMVKEGSQVNKGLLVARFDSKPFGDSLQKAEQAYADAQASFDAALKLLSLQKEEEEGRIEEDTRKLTIAKIQADNVRNGSGPLKRKTLQQQVHQAQRIFELSRNELDDMNLLLEKGHVSIRERDKATDKLATASEQLAVVNAELANFNSYLWPQMLREAELLVSGAESNLERTKRTGEIQIQNRAAEREKRRRDVENKLISLEKARIDLLNCDIYSPADGVLLYPELPRENGRRKIQIGDSVWVGQTFMEVPDTSELIAELQVREVDVAHIAPGMKAEIMVDAFPERIFTGIVELVASLAREDEANANIRRFYTRVRLTGNTEQIHVGMSVTAKVIYREVEEVVAIPSSAVFYKETQAMVRKIQGGKAQDSPVVLGERGVLLVEVADGLQVGEQIYNLGQ